MPIKLYLQKRVTGRDVQAPVASPHSVVGRRAASPRRLTLVGELGPLRGLPGRGHLSLTPVPPGSVLPAACVRHQPHEQAAGGEGGCARLGRGALVCLWHGPKGVRLGQSVILPVARRGCVRLRSGRRRPWVPGRHHGIAFGADRTHFGQLCFSLADLWPSLVLYGRECWPPARVNGCIPPHEPSTLASVPTPVWASPLRGRGPLSASGRHFSLLNLDCGPQNGADVNGTRGGRLPEPPPPGPVSSADVPRCTAPSRACEVRTGPGSPAVIRGPAGAHGPTQTPSPLQRA